MKKRLVGILTAVVMLPVFLTAGLLPAHAQRDWWEYSDYCYHGAYFGKLGSSREYVFCHYNPGLDPVYNSGTVVRIPAEVPGMPQRKVVRVGHYAYYGDNNMREVIIPDTVRSIGDYAFYRYECNDWLTITIPASVTSIGYDMVCPVSVKEDGMFVQASPLEYNVTIRGYAGSYAETYAKKYGIRFEAIEEAPVAASLFTGGRVALVGGAAAAGIIGIAAFFIIRRRKKNAGAPPEPEQCS